MSEEQDRHSKALDAELISDPSTYMLGYFRASLAGLGCE
jgi:hypothetical protein